MNQRVVVPSSGIQLSSLTPARVVEVTKPQRGQSVAVNLGDGHGTQLDLSSVAHESLTLAHVGTTLVIQFDNQSAVVADPFFDFSGKPFPHLEVSFGGRDIFNGEQFAALLSETVGQSVQPDADKTPPSGADFHSPSVDLLPSSSLPLALLGQELGLLGQGALGAGAGSLDNAPSGHSMQTASPVPTLTIPSAGGPATQVFEAGLLASRGPGESAGSHAGQPSFPVSTRAGTINFTSPDGVQSVSLGGHMLGESAQTFTDATGSLTASYSFDANTHKGTINYTWPQSDSRRVPCSEDARPSRCFI